MPRRDDPRIMVRFSRPGFAVVERAAQSVGASTGGLIRECAERYAVEVARMVERGEIVIRRQNGDGPVEDRATASPARPVREVSEHDRVMLARQAALNKARDRK